MHSHHIVRHLRGFSRSNNSFLRCMTIASGGTSTMTQHRFFHTVKSQYQQQRSSESLADHLEEHFEYAAQFYKKVPDVNEFQRHIYENMDQKNYMRALAMLLALQSQAFQESQEQQSLEHRRMMVVWKYNILKQLIECHFHLNNYHEALHTADTLLKVQDECEELGMKDEASQSLIYGLYLVSVMHQRHGNVKEAIQLQTYLIDTLREQLKNCVDPVEQQSIQHDLINTLEQRGLSYYKAGQSDEALTDFNELLEITNEQNMSALSGRAMVLLLKEEFDMAMSDAKQCLDRSSDPEHVYISLQVVCGVLLKQGDLSKAVSELTEYIRRYPKHSFLYMARIKSYVALGEYEKALVDIRTLEMTRFESVINVSDEYMICLRKLGMFDEMEKLEERISNYKQQQQQQQQAPQ